MLSSQIGMQIVKPDIRVYNLVEELASGPLPSWNPVPTVLVLNKVSYTSGPESTCSLNLLTSCCNKPVLWK